MKNLVLLLSLAAISLGFSSCCSMFGMPSTQTAGYRTETKQVKTCGHGYKTVAKKSRIGCGPCVRFYCPKKDCCGTTSDSTLKLATSQSATGSPNLGLIPSMKTMAP